jgi:hypothetical protein
MANASTLGNMLIGVNCSFRLTTTIPAAVVKFPFGSPEREIHFGFLFFLARRPWAAGGAAW